MKKKKETEPEVKFSCEFCRRNFIKEGSLLKHICEYKHRWLEKDRRGNQIGFQCWVDFHKKHTATKKEKTYEDFIRSAYYIAFIKFGNYAVEINCINIPRYVDYLLKEKIKVDVWISDSNYNLFLMDYLKTENPLDAVHRSVETCMKQAEEENMQLNDYLRYGNRNKICHLITSGRISPWLLYHSESGMKFLDELNDDLVKIVYDYINPVQWAIKFKKEQDNVTEVKALLQELKW